MKTVLIIAMIILLWVLWYKTYNKKQVKNRNLKIDEVFESWKSKFENEGVDFPIINNMYGQTKRELSFGLGFLEPNSVITELSVKYYNNSLASNEDYDIMFAAILQTKVKHKMLLDKYGEEKGNILINDKYFIGMTMEELIDSKGDARYKNKTEFKTKIRDTWSYGLENFTFDNGVLVKYHQLKN